MDQVQSLVLDPLKPYLAPITHNLPAPINDLAISLLGEKCHSALLLDIDFSSHPECVSLAISKALGIGIITAASVVKVPQIIKLLKSKSSEGLSFTSYFLETASFVITLAYNIRNGFPFSTFGETAFIAIQDVVISVLILVYSGETVGAGAFVAAAGAAAYALLSSNSLITDAQMVTLQAGAGGLSIASKVPQILAIWQQGGTGQLSAFAVFNYLIGSLTRIYTTLQEVDDVLILYGFIAGFALNAVLAAQVLYYWNSPTTAGHAKEVGAGNRGGLQGVGQKGAATTMTEEAKMKGSPVSGTSSARPSSSSGRRRG